MRKCGSSDLILFIHVVQRDYRFYLVVVDQPPKVNDGVGERHLSCDEFTGR